MPVQRTKLNFAPTNVPSGTTEADPIKTAWLPVGLGLGIIPRILNGGTAPTTEASVGVRVRAKESATWEYLGGTLSAGKVASQPYTWTLRVDPEWEEAQVVFFGNSGAAVTASAEISRLDSLV